MAKKAIIRAKIDGVLTELLFKTGVENVVYATVDGSEVMLSTKLAEIIADLALKDNTADREAAIEALRTELMGEGVPETLDTFKELADAIANNQEVADALNEAIGNKADKSTVESIQSALTALTEAVDGKADKATTLAGYGITDAYTQAEVNTKIAEAVSDATGGESAASVKSALEAYQSSNDAAVAEVKGDVEALEADSHTHSNKTLLDTYTQTEANLADAVAKKHEHSNKSVLDNITDAKISAWDSAEQNAKDYADSLAGNYDAAGSAAQALTDAKAYANGLAGNYDAAGAAATAEANAKTYADNLGTVTIGGVAYDLEIEIVE